MLGVHLTEGTAEWNAAHAAGAERILAGLKSAPPRSLIGVGHVPYVRFYPPDVQRQAVNAKARTPR